MRLRSSSRTMPHSSTRPTVGFKAHRDNLALTSALAVRSIGIKHFQHARFDTSHLLVRRGNQLASWGSAEV
jgi:hypothetical protein